jgi:uncharacterized membrane protein
MNERRLLRHVFDTYNTLRRGMTLMALFFPFLLLVVGWWHGLPLQGSMSAYYWASIEGDPPVRVWFVGGIFAIGSFLLLYKGYTFWEDWALNVAALLLVLVALVPMSWKCGSELGHCPSVNPHSWFAIAFFACIVFVAQFQSGETVPELRDEAREQRYRNLYRITSLLLVLSPVAAVVAHLLTRRYQALTYFLELFGIWAFALYWWIKSRELRESHAEQQVLNEASKVAKG